MANCAVINCSNSYYQLQRWLQCPCDIHYEVKDNFQTPKHILRMNCGCNYPFKLFSFPKNEMDRAIWTKNVNRKNGNINWTPKTHSKICSEHFVEKEPTALHPYPVLKMGHDQIVKSARKPPKVRNEDTHKNINGNNSKQEESKSSCESKPLNLNIPDHTYFFNYKCKCVDDCNCIGCQQKELQNKILKQKISQLEQKLFEVNQEKNSELFFSVDSILNSDKKVRNYLGLPNKCYFLKLLQMIKPKCKNLRYWKGEKKVISHKLRKDKQLKNKPGPARKMSVKYEFMLTLMKLRLNLTLEFLADLFGISLTITSQILSTWIKLLSKLFKNLIHHPSKEEVKETLPKAFQDHVPQARGIIDCSEFFIEKPSSLYVQSVTWSDYKQHNTVKVLVDISPTGIIQFVSDAWGGRTSDKKIVQSSGYLDTLEAGDMILADRGFPIAEELLQKGAKIYIPPGARGTEQMTRENVSKTKKVANLRIHVERAINRIKWFRILSETIPISMVPLIDDIIIICSAFINLYPPLVK